MARKFGVKITFRKVEPENQNPKSQKVGEQRGPPKLIPTGRCVCGKTNAQCSDDWDRELGITSHSAEDYMSNLAKVRTARERGLDPYCSGKSLAASGYESVWTPFVPPSSMGIPPTMESESGKKPKGKARGKSRRDSRGKSRGSR